MPAKRTRSRVWTYGSNTLLSSLFFLGIIAFIALIAERHPWRVDLTESGQFSLSEQTRNILKSIDKPVAVKAFYATAAPEQVKARDLLETYRYHSKQISYEFIDPDRQPETARRYEIRAYGTVVVEGYDKTQSIQEVSEESLSNALLKLSRSEQKKIYFLVGHGEHATQSDEKDGYANVRSALEKENYTVADLNLLQQTSVPADAAVVIIPGPRKPLFSQEVASLKSYLDGGGRLVVLLDPHQDGGLRDLVKAYGVELKEDIVIDKLSRVFGGSYLMPVVMQYGSHKITENYDVATFYPEARSVQPVQETPDTVQVEVLASTSENAWSETNMALLGQGQASFDEKEDVIGPVPLMVLSEISVSEKNPSPAEGTQEKAGSKSTEETNPASQEKRAYLLVAGDSNFVDNTNFGLSGNGDLFLNAVNFLAEEETLITIEPRAGEGKPMLLTRTQAQLMFWLVVVVVPLLVLLSGLAVYRVRRAQR